MRTSYSFMEASAQKSISILPDFPAKHNNGSSRKFNVNCFFNLEKSELAVYSHTTAVYRGSLFIFGGIKMDTPTNDLLQINLKTAN